MGCASSTPLAASGPPPEAPPYDLRAADPGAMMAGDGSVAGKVRQTVTGMADALPVQDMIDGVSNVKDEAFHKLQDFGESVKDKVESVVEEVEDKIGSALGTMKDKTEEVTEEVSAAQEEVEKAAEEATEEVQEMVEEKMEEKEEEVKEVVDTMVEDLEESLPLPEKQDSEKDFQMNTSKGSRASTAELSRKSGDEGENKDIAGEEEVKMDQPESPKDDALGENTGAKTPEEENSIQEQSDQLTKDDSPASGKTSPTQTSPIVDTQTDQTDESPITAESAVPLDAIPIDKDEMTKEETKAEEKKEMMEEKESLTVDLPAEEGKEASGTEEKEARSESQNQSPPPHNDTPRPPSDIDQSIEPLIDKTTVTPPEDQPENQTENQPENQTENQLEQELGNGTRSPGSPDGKNDSAISSSSLSPEQDRADSGMDERQGTPIIEVA